MRVADYIFQYLAEHGIRHVFLVTGGSAMHLNNALKKEARIRPVCHHHEQAAAIAAEGYARTSGQLAVVNVTSGPGGTNALTGVIGQWLDSVPVLYLSGQVKYETTLASACQSGLRQLGDQEINIIDMVRPVTKFAKMIIDPQAIKADLDRALHCATSGRPGPVWLDIPLNVQGAPINVRQLKSVSQDLRVPAPSRAMMRAVVHALQSARRPLVIAGHGVRLAQAQKEFLDLVRRIKIPVVTTFNGYDLMANSFPSFIGRIGTLGSRAGNFALQNADLVLCLGTRNNIRQVSYQWTSFAKQAKKIIVDIDSAELVKKTVTGDLKVHSDAKIFIHRLMEALPLDFLAPGSWLSWCLVRKRKYPVVLEAYRTPRRQSVHPYHFIEALTTQLRPGAVAVAGNGTACVAMFQAGIVKTGQRIFWNSGCASMGYDLPAAIGAALAARREVVCVTGDGSLQMNLQELQTIRHYRIPIKLFVLNNNGYRSIELTQQEFFHGDFIGCNASSGVSFPDLKKLASLYGLQYFRIRSHGMMPQMIARVLRCQASALCEVVLDRDYVFAPKVSSQRLPDGRIISRPLEDLYPFLSSEEMKLNTIVPDAYE